MPFCYQFIDGRIEVYVGDLQYKPIVWAVDRKPIDVKFISFASNEGSRVLFFHNCDGDDTIGGVSAVAAHPVLLTPNIEDDELLTTKCHYEHAWDNKYMAGVKLAALKNSQPDGFVFQVPIYVRGIRDAHILLTSNGLLDAKDGYEFRK